MPSEQWLLTAAAFRGAYRIEITAKIKIFPQRGAAVPGPLSSSIDSGVSAGADAGGDSGGGSF